MKKIELVEIRQVNDALAEMVALFRVELRSYKGIAGALITETLFAIPGIGFISYNAMVAGDIPFSMFYMTFLAILTLLGNLISDILYAVVDPRVRIA